MPRTRRHHIDLLVLQICIDVMISRCIVVAELRRRRGEIDGVHLDGSRVMN